MDEQVAVLEQALVFKGEVTSATADSSLTTAATQAGWTYVATGDAFDYNGKHIEAGDLVIVASDAAAGTPSPIIVVERNLDGAVTAAAGLTNNYVILGNGDQSVKVSTITLDALTTAIANANSALQNVTASTSTGDYVTIEAARDASTTNVSVGVKVGTLIDASNGGETYKALADARDVYEELTRVEEVTATSITTMDDSLGLGNALNPNWSQGSGINEASTYREVIEELHGQVGGNVVNSIGGAHGVISLDTTPANDGSVAFAMDGSTLKGTVTGWTGLVGRVTAAETSIGEVSTRLNDLSTYVRQTVDASIDRLDASVNALETEVSTYKVKTIEGETGISARANDEFVAVSASEPDATGKVILDASVQLATDVTIPTGTEHEAATGLATDGWVKDFLTWEVIE